ncbi:MAG: hypothetical protein Roseis2KO_48040 [Roseivirga sp.]
MSLEEDYLIERFLKGELSGEEDQRFRKRMASDMEFREKVTLEQQLFDTFDEDRWSSAEKPDQPEVTAYAELFDSEEAKAMKVAIASSANRYKNGPAKTRIRPLWIYASAAAVLLVLSFYFLFSGSTTAYELYKTYLDRTELPSMVTRADEAAEQIKGQAYFENEEFAAAEKAFAGLIQQGGQNASFYIYLALAQAELTKLDEAMATLDGLIESDLLDSQKGYWYKSLVYLKADDVRACEDLLSTIVENRYYNYRLAEELIKELD